MKKFFKNYKLGMDFWALLLYLAIMLPNVIYLCLGNEDPGGGVRALEIVSIVFEILSVAAMLFVIRKERTKKGFFDSLYLTSALFLALYYVAWIFCFLNRLNLAVLLFLAVCPCAAMLLFELERRNVIALAATGLFTIFHVLAALI